MTYGNAFSALSDPTVLKDTGLVDDRAQAPAGPDGGAQVTESVAGEGGWSGLLNAYAEAAAQASS